nr:hypothetical protein [Geobacillus thermoleovorans]
MAAQADRYEAVLAQYGLRPERMEQRGKAVKVYTNRGVFALKPLESEQEAAAVCSLFSMAAPVVSRFT